MMLALADQQQPVAAARLVHHVAGHDAAWCRPRPARGTAATARRAAPGPGRPSARRARAASGCRPARRPATRGCAGRRTGCRRAGRRRSARPTSAIAASASAAVDAAVERGEVAGVLPHGQVRVDARRLGEVADRARAAPATPAGWPSTVTVPDCDLLHADDRAHQRGLAAAARARAGR